MKKNSVHIYLISCCFVLLSSCATQANRDPLEHYNRVVFNTNTQIYKYVLTPIATTYNAIIPGQFQSGINNLYENLEQPNVILNDILQLKPKYAYEDTMRILINTVFGFFGLFDAAKHAGFPSRSYQGFGVTFAKWGWRYTPYIVWPILGPNTLGNSLGAIMDTFGAPINYVDDAAIVWGPYTAYISNLGAQYLPLLNSVSAAAIDPYTTVKSAYLQNYDYQVSNILQLKSLSSQANDQAVLDILSSE